MNIKLMIQIRENKRNTKYIANYKLSEVTENSKDTTYLAIVRSTFSFWVASLLGPHLYSSLA